MLCVKQIDVSSIDYSHELELRELILRRPQNLILSEDDLRYDALFIHLGAYLEDELIGCCIYRESSNGVVQIKQVCVLPKFQHQEVGRTLMLEAEKRIKNEGYKQIMLHARVNAWNFYEHLDYEFEGETFIEVGIKHKKMIKML